MSPTYHRSLKPRHAVKLLMLMVLCSLLSNCKGTEDQTIKVGILHSLTGTMAISEQSVVDATVMAIEEINNQGGILGKKIEPIIIDGKSDWSTFAAGARTLIEQHQVSAIFGCWTSASRKMVKPVVEEFDNLLFYPVQYEGLENSPNIIYTGAAPNQQITPAVKWSIDNIGKRVFLAASDYVFPRAANTVIHKQIHALNAKVVGEYYIPLGHKDVDGIINAIAQAQPDVILNTINGDSNLAFFQELNHRELDIPVMSFSIAEDELQQLDITTVVGHYSAWNYFQSLNTPENRRFVSRFKRTYGDTRTTNASMEAGYIGVYLWAKAVQQANTKDPTTVREALKGASFDSPEGNVFISGINNHLWKPFYIGQIQSNGQFSIVWRQPKPIRPLPFPAYRSKSSWEKYLRTLYMGWNQRWAAPPPSGGKST